MRNEKVYKLTLTALMAALSYVVFTFLQIKIALPGGDATSLHLGNAVCVLGALLLGGVYGGLGGAIGMTIGDLLDPVYIIYAPKTFLLKFCIGLITGLVAHKIGKISTSNDIPRYGTVRHIRRRCVFDVFIIIIVVRFIRHILPGIDSRSSDIGKKYCNCCRRGEYTLSHSFFWHFLLPPLVLHTGCGHRLDDVTLTDDKERDRYRCNDKLYHRSCTLSCRASCDDLIQCVLERFQLLTPQKSASGVCP